jgi:LacI family transcriptional regulator, repressor for deo operon, udp, cdd, tsx, nupC, and nupG
VRVTLGDVAENAGVSQATASRVLSGKGGVAHGTRTAVISAAATLGYRRTTRGRVVGVVLPELVNPIFATFAHRFATSLAQSGYTPVLCSQTVGGVSEDEWVELLLDKEMAALIVVSGAHADVNADLGRYQRLLDRHIPLVLVNGHAVGIDAVFVSDDDHEAMRLAVSHLLELGHERIGLATGPSHYVPVTRKIEGFKAAALAAKAKKPLVEFSLFTIEGGRAAASRLLDKGVTAIVCASDLMALGAIEACRARKLRVPRDISIVGYDDSPMMAFTDPALTTVRQAVPAMCSAAVRALRDQLAGRTVPRHEYLFRPELVVRGSTGAARA